MPMFETLILPYILLSSLITLMVPCDKQSRHFEGANLFAVRCLITRKNGLKNSFFFNPADPRGITSREAYQDFQSSLTSSAGGAKGCSDHRFRAPPAGYTAQLLALHEHRDNNQYRRRLIKSSRL